MLSRLWFLIFFFLVFLVSWSLLICRIELLHTPIQHEDAVENSREKKGSKEICSSGVLAKLLLPWLAQCLRNISDNRLSYVYYYKQYHLPKVNKRQSNPFEWRVTINLYSNESQIYFVYVTFINHRKTCSDNLNLRNGILHQTNIWERPLLSLSKIGLKTKK